MAEDVEDELRGKDWGEMEIGSSGSVNGAQNGMNWW